MRWCQHGPRHPLVTTSVDLSPSEGPSAQRATPSAPTRRGRPELMWGSDEEQMPQMASPSAQPLSSASTVLRVQIPSAQPLSSASCAPWQVAPSCPRLRAPHIATPEQMWGSDKEQMWGSDKEQMSSPSRAPARSCPSHSDAAMCRPASSRPNLARARRATQLGQLHLASQLPTHCQRWHPGT